MLHRSKEAPAFVLAAIIAWLVLVGQAASWAASAPTVDPVGPVQVPGGKTLILPLTAKSQEGLPLTYSVTSSAPAQISVILHTNNPWLKLGVADFGVMSLQLLRDRAPTTVDTISSFVQSGFYRGLTFHRVIPGFMIQGGDPLGTGTGGPDFRFDDEFHPLAIFSGGGQLAMANSGKDTDGSQFFITMGPQRFLDFNHTIFGQLVRGFEVLTNISLVPTNTNNKPKNPVVITNASLFTNTTDAVITLVASNAAASAVITVRVTDPTGATSSTTFAANGVADTVDDPPILGPITNVISPENASVQIILSSTDLESNAVQYGYSYLSGPADATGGLAGNVMTINPPIGYTGPMKFLFKVCQTNAISRGSTADINDYQRMTIAVGDTASTVFGPNFLAKNGVTFSNRVIATFTNVNGAKPADNYSAQINWGDGTLTANALILARTNGPGFEVLGSHAFTNDGDHRVVTTITNVRGGTASSTGKVIIPPAISISMLNAKPAVSWPAWGFDYQLLSGGDPASTNWSVVTNLPVVAGFENVVSNLNAPTNRFFRLRR